MAETDYTSLMSSDWTGSSGNFGGGKERYQNSNYTADQKVMYQSFTAPASGIYEIKFYAVTSSTSGRGFDNKWGLNIAQAYATAGSNKATVAMEVINQTGCTLVTDANIRTLSVEATEGETIEYGLENIAEGGNWYTIKELSAKMKTIAEIFQAQYDEAYAIWEHSTENEAGARATFKTYVDALNTAMSGTLADAQTASNNLAAQLVIYESKSYPVKGSGVKYDFTSKMNMAINAWTCVQGNGPAQYGFTGATETYGNTSAGKVMYQTISGLANGEYEIHFYAVANAANGGGVVGTKTTVYANDQELEIDVITQNGCTPSDYERTFTVMVTDGSIEYGFKNTVAAGNWYLCKNVALYMTGAPDLSDYYNAIATKLVTANGLKSSPMKSTVLSALQNAIDATEGYTAITIIGTLETLSDNLTTAINDANTSVSNYEEALAILNEASSLDAAGQAYYAANETVAAIQSAYDARTLEAVTNEQKAACIAVLPDATRQQTSDNADWTAVIVNPSFETGDFTGWTNTGSMATQNNSSFPLKDGTYYAEFWQPNGTKSVSQTVADLPAGVYRVTAKAFARTVTSAKLSAGTSETVIPVDADANTYSVDYTLLYDGDLTFGFESVGTGANASWICVDNFTLEFLHAPTAADYKEVLNGAITSANGARKIANEGTGVFQIPAVAGTTLAGAITDAQNVYNNVEATISDVTTAISTLNTAVETYEATTLNAPDAEKKYQIVLEYDGWEYDGKAITYIANDRADMGLYNVKYLAAPNANLAQAFTLTQVSGNTYTMSQTDAEGNTRYLCTGVPYSGNTSQIRTTTTAGDALVVKIIATGTANVFNIYNTAANNYIGSQDAGVFTVNSHINFTIAEAAEASIDINTTDAGWGTTMLPFAQALPEGVKAYTCAEVDGDQLTIVSVDALEANKPYIIEGTWKANVSGWGLGKELTTTEGLLTGVYEATTVPVNSYVLQKNDNKVGFYQVAEGKQPTAAANRAYLTVPAESARAAFFFGDDTTTGIQAIEALTSGKAQIFNASGAQLPRLQKGMNIIRKADGKSYKVVVK